MPSTTNSLVKQWQFVNRLPLGKHIFSRMIGLYIPYTGSISAKVIELKPGYARVQLRDRRKVRNHLNSIHAIALANLAEFTGNLAVVAGMPRDARFIVKNFSIEYLKKARGTLIGECSSAVIESNAKQDIEVKVAIKNKDGEIVAAAVMQTLIGPKK
ncbi:DUF4442 domain-containing protein [bacterium]|nr:DUF4442 domain-containing protein [bacterium]